MSRSVVSSATRSTARNTTRTAIRTALALLLLIAPPLHAQLVSNGTLSANANGWTLFSACSDAVWDGTVGNPAGSIRLNSCGQGDSDPTAAQTISGLTVGATYTLSVDVLLHANIGGGTGKSFGIFLDSEPANPILLTEFLDGSWHTVTVNFTAASSSATLIFAAELDPRTPGGPASSTDVSYYIDNISLTQLSAPKPPAAVPTLSELAMLMLGILLAAHAVRRLRPRRSPR
jgi:Carbohydrate binding domain